ncbi:hypothetical protein B0H34DRAFT_678288 [Crassisporium funariophilum]|nr:hypothetical protein B0H34DRAFT_678288 [Crassisporium funariophilum]
MRLSLALGLTTIISLVTWVEGSNQLFSRTSTSGGTDTCGEVNAVLKVPNFLLGGRLITLGNISSSFSLVVGIANSSTDACLCVSTLPSYIATNPFTIAGAAIAGKAAVTSALTAMINSCLGHQQCNYPGNSVPVCQHGNPCGFTCKDGYSPSPSSHPTDCVCAKPYTLCNGKCGIYKACPSGYVKRELSAPKDKRCPKGLTACAILGRNLKSWECVDTQSDLESCGGCMLSLHPNFPETDGVDCTAITGVSDVSCGQGQCIVHRCMPGYDVNFSGNSCVYSEQSDPVILASQFGLEHVPLGN